jgi:hypothetical protein
MKRIVLAMTAILVAGLTQAAAIDWGTTGSYTVSDNLGGTLTSSGQGYLVYLGAGGTGTISTDGSGNFIFGNGATVVAGTGNSTTGGQNNGFDWNQDGTLAMKTFNYTWNVDYSAGAKFVLLFTSVNASGVNPLTLPNTGYYYESGAFTTTAADNSESDTFVLSSNVQTLNPVVVPEPCTMALAFVGAGAMALRRRFAKKS